MKSCPHCCPLSIQRCLCLSLFLFRCFALKCEQSKFLHGHENVATEILAYSKGDWLIHRETGLYTGWRLVYSQGDWLIHIETGSYTGRLVYTQEVGLLIQRETGLYTGRLAYAQGDWLIYRETGLFTGQLACSQGDWLIHRETGLYTGRLAYANGCWLIQRETALYKGRLACRKGDLFTGILANTKRDWLIHLRYIPDACQTGLLTLLHHD